MTTFDVCKICLKPPHGRIVSGNKSSHKFRRAKYGSYQYAKARGWDTSGFQLGGAVHPKKKDKAGR